MNASEPADTTQERAAAMPRASLPPTAWDREVEHEWPDVRIDRVEVQRATDCASLAVVRAGLFLGRLLPPDVTVELTIEEKVERPQGCESCERMWTSRTYENGSYQFEAHVPIARVVGARRMAVHVRPARQPADASPRLERTTEVSLTRMRAE
jgi:hypothetical protein